MTQEQSLWKISPSQWLNIGHYLGATATTAAIIAGGIYFPLAFIALIIPIAWATYAYLKIKTLRFELTNERLRITSGILNQRIDEIELYRVKDSLLVRSWWMRLLGLASIHLTTSDRSQPSLTIPAVPNGLDLRETLRQEVETLRAKYRVRELDLTESDLNSEIE